MAARVHAWVLGQLLLFAIYMTMASANVYRLQHYGHVTPLETVSSGCSKHAGMQAYRHAVCMRIHIGVHAYMQART